jgi:hypothetical protein
METNTATKLTSLIHLLNAEYLTQCYKELKRGKAAGVDGRTKESYRTKEIQDAITEVMTKILYMVEP